jgi:hypothetical protein
VTESARASPPEPSARRAASGPASAARTARRAQAGSLAADWIDREIARLQRAVEEERRPRPVAEERRPSTEKVMLAIRWFCYVSIVQLLIVLALNALGWR